MSLTPYQALEQIDLLYEQAAEAIETAQYALAESLLVEAVRLADDYAELLTQIKMHYWLADAQRMQGRYEEALPTYMWLIGVANAPHQAAQLDQTDNSLWYLANAYIDIAEIGRFLPQMPLDDLYQVIEQGIAFLTDVGRSHWRHALQCQKALLLAERERKNEEARREFEEALAQKRRVGDSPGGGLTNYLIELGRQLIRMREYDAAANYLHEVLELSEATVYDRYSASTQLAWLEESRKNWDVAEQHARDAVAFASQVENPGAKNVASYRLTDVLMRRGKVTDAAQAAVTMWRWGRQCVTIRDNTKKYYAVNKQYWDAHQLANVRLAMARSVLGLEPNPDAAIPETLPSFSPQAGQAALRYLRAAQRWVARAQEPARKLDGQGGITQHQDWLESQANDIERLQSLVETEQDDPEARQA